mgnify:CR=1 FL=1
MSILIVDDDPLLCSLLRMALNREGFETHEVFSGKAALEYLSGALVDLVLLDVMMPHVDGWEVLGHLRQHPLTQHAPVIVCSILAQEDLAFSLGASDYLRKPVSRTAFLQALERQTRRQGPGSP